jgi:hypothetical protein
MSLREIGEKQFIDANYAMALAPMKGAQELLFLANRQVVTSTSYSSAAWLLTQAKSDTAHFQYLLKRRC